ncbi:MAG TPA: hypothetical protein DER33_05565 [Syntrophomonas sp.]|jgi:predicted tellurium resistance membrane protein TerC|nr:hypothetical protein [Syntrophomonas sp.]HCF71047.1 hypothetical protein [Syntrophomonas sp.]
MGSIIAIGLLFAIIGFYQIPALVQRKYWRELAAYSVLMVVAFILTLMRVMELKLPQPNEGVMVVLKYFNLI